MGSTGLFANLFSGLLTIAGTIGVIAGAMMGRDEPLYGGLGVLLFQMLGLYSIITYSAAVPGFDNIILVVMGLFNTIFVISFINWIRGKGE